MDQPTYTLTLTETDLNIIGQLLTQAPWSVANPLIQKLQEQVREQNKADQ